MATLKLLTPKHMSESVWDTYRREGEDGDGNNFFLRNTDFNENPRIVKFLDIEWRAQTENTPDVYKTPDGRELLLTLEVDGEKHGYTAKSHSNALIIALKQSNIEPGDRFELTRTGEKMETRFKANKIREDGTVLVQPEGNGIPF